MTFSVRDNIEKIRQRIAAAAGRVNRRPEEIRLMAITKTVPDQLIREAIEVGVDLIGENYIQEAQRKIDLLGRDVPWHFTGHLQTNKAKFAVRLFSMIHSVDRIELARELERQAEKLGQKIDILLEVNLGDEATKSGIHPQEAISLVKEVALLPHLCVKGLMAIPPWSADPEEARPYFRALRQLRDDIDRQNIPGVEMRELSMGMSDDFEIAVEEGATIVRIGRAIFGPRER